MTTQWNTFSLRSSQSTPSSPSQTLERLFGVAQSFNGLALCVASWTTEIQWRRHVLRAMAPKFQDTVKSNLRKPWLLKTYLCQMFFKLKAPLGLPPPCIGRMGWKWFIRYWTADNSVLFLILDIFVWKLWELSPPRNKTYSKSSPGKFRLLW